MSEAIKMPLEVQAACDKVVAATLAGQAPPTADLRPVQEWLETEGWSLIADLPDEILLTDLSRLSWYFEDSWVVSEFIGWAPDEDLDIDNLTDVERLGWARYICASIDKGEFPDQELWLVTAHPVPLVSTKGERAVIACVLVFQGQAGFGVEWHGTWPDRSAFEDYLSQIDRYCLLGHASELADERILSVWTRRSSPELDKPTILASREVSSMASAWREFLCLTQGNVKNYRLFTGQYEALVSAYDYFNEETEEYKLPDEIDGKAVVGIEDEYIVGGDLQWSDVSKTVEFEEIKDPAIAEWLSASGWSSHASLDQIQKAIQHLS